MTGSRPRNTVLLYLLGAVLLWGTSFVAIKTAMRDFEPMTVMWLRMAIASLAFAPLWSRVPRPAYRPGDWKLLGASALFLPCLYYLLEGYAVQLTTSSQAGVISSIMPLIVAAGGWVLLRDRPSPRSAAAIAVSLVGVAVLSLGGSAQEAAPNPALGNLLELGAMFAAAGSTLSIKRLSERYGAWFLTGTQAAVGAVFFLPFALRGGPGPLLHASALSWACVGYLAIGVSLVAFGLYNSALARLPASAAALAINMIPGVALLTGWLLLGESLTAAQLLAAVVIVGAVVFAETGTHPIEPAQEIV